MTPSLLGLDPAGIEIINNMVGGDFVKDLDKDLQEFIGEITPDGRGSFFGFVKAHAVVFAMLPYLRDSFFKNHPEWEQDFYSFIFQNLVGGIATAMFLHRDGESQKEAGIEEMRRIMIRDDAVEGNQLRDLILQLWETEQ